MHTILASAKPSKRRCRPLRIEQPAALWFITTRTIEERFWLHPILSSGLAPMNHRARRLANRLDRLYHRRVLAMVATANRRMGPHQAPLTVDIAKRALKGLVGSALARAQENCRKTGVEVDVFAFVAMSNHVHLVARTHGKNLAKFMGYFKARVAEGINYLTGRRGPLFSRRYDAQRILNDHAACGRVAYTIDNPRKANLVAHHNEWPGLLLCYGLGDSDQPRFEYLARTAWHKAGRPESIDPFFASATLTLSPLPHLTDIKRVEYARMVDGWIGDLEQHANDNDRHGATTKATTKRPRPLGLEKIVNVAFDYRPEQPSFKRRPYAFGTPEEKRAYFELCSDTDAMHRDASNDFLTINRNVRFPSGTYPPPIMYAA